MAPLAMLMISGLLMVTFVATVAIPLVSATLAIFIATLSSVVVTAIRNPQATSQRGDPDPHGRIDNRALHISSFGPTLPTKRFDTTGDGVNMSPSSATVQTVLRRWRKNSHSLDGGFVCAGRLGVRSSMRGTVKTRRTR